MRRASVHTLRWIIPSLATALIAAGCAGFAAAIPSTSVAPTTAAATSTAIVSQPTTTVEKTVEPIMATMPADTATATSIVILSQPTTAVEKTAEPVTTTMPADTAATGIATPSVTVEAPVASPLATPTVAPVDTQRPVTPTATLYQDDFTDPKSGWPNELVFQDYYVGYHEPDFYHVEVHTPNDSAIVTVPGRTFDNFSAETRVLVSAANTAPSGDFRYGLVVRRTGNRYYALAISSRTKTWYVLKSGSDKIQVLGQGTQDSIQGLQAADTLRVNAQGPLLTFFVNGQLVSQINDQDYVTGGVGFYVETFDSPKAHIHYDSLVISQPENLPAQPVLSPTSQASLVTCTVTVNLLRLRPTPQISTMPAIAGLFEGTQLDALARNADGTWIWGRVHGSSLEGWVSAQPTLITCNGSVASLPPQ